MFRVHSGRQPKYGLSLYPGKQVHTPLSHWVFAPQGEGLHGSFGSGSTVATMMDENMNDLLTFSGTSLVLDGSASKFLLGAGEQPLKGSPVNPSRQEHMGT